MTNTRTSPRALLVAALVVVLAGVGLAAPAPSEAAGGKLPPLGALAGGPDKLDSYSEWLGREVSHATTFIGGATWDDMATAAGNASRKWRGTNTGVTYSLSMFPPSGSYAAANRGDYDAGLRRVAERLVANDPDGIIRIGWEANGTWFDWSFGDNATGYRDYFRRIVNIFRSVPGQQFQFEWSVARRIPDIDLNAYPGDAWVDIIGMGFYNTSYGPNEVDFEDRWRRFSQSYGTSLAWLEEFSRQHNKPMAFAEWGMTTIHHDGVEHDDPRFIERFYDWLVAHSDRIAYVNYFERSKNHQGWFGLSNGDTPFPRTAARFRQLFGGTGSTTAPPTSSAPTTTTAAPAPTTTRAPATTTTRAPAPTTRAPAATTTTTRAPAPTTTTKPATRPPSTTTTTAPLADPPEPQRTVDGTCPPANRHAGTASHDGYWILRSDGSVDAVGVPFHGDLSGTGLTAVSIESTSTGNGYWILASDGSVWPFGDAGHRGDVAGLNLAGAPRSISSPAVHDAGYWLAGADGGVFAFGLPFLGSMGDVALVAPVISLSSTATGDGYWLVGADGGVFAFGDAAFAGSTGGWELAAPIVAMAAEPSGVGYWLYGADGGVFAFGVPFHGSLPQYSGCGNPSAVHLEPTATGGGYWLVDTTGFVYAFGDAPHFGNAQRSSSVVVGFAAG